MPEENKPTTTAVPTHKPHEVVPVWRGKTITVKRGEEGKEVESPAFGEETFGKKAGGGTLAGRPFLCPILDEKNVNAWMQWLGMEDVLAILNSSLRRIFGGLFTANIQSKLHEGKFDLNEWMEAAADLSAGRETLSDIDETIDELRGSIDELMDTTEFAAGDSSIRDQIMELHSKLKPLKVRREQIEAVYADRVAKRRAKKEAAEAAAKTATVTA